MHWPDSMTWKVCLDLLKFFKKGYLPMWLTEKLMGHKLNSETRLKNQPLFHMTVAWEATVQDYYHQQSSTMWDQLGKFLGAPRYVEILRIGNDYHICRDFNQFCEEMLHPRIQSTWSLLLSCPQPLTILTSKACPQPPTPIPDWWRETSPLFAECSSILDSHQTHVPIQ